MKTLDDVKAARFTVSNDRPPNFDEIIAVLPEGKKDGVIFTYGNTVYNPSFVTFTPELAAHEATHVLQQTVDMDKDAWWDLYLIDPTFRAAQELEAHQMEYRMARFRGVSRQQRRVFAKGLAKRLSGPLYGRSITEANALAFIKEKEHV